MVVPVTVAAQPPQVLDVEQHPPVALNLRQMLALVAQQALVGLMTWQHVDDVPERRPATEAASSHIGGDQPGCSANLHCGQKFDEITFAFSQPFAPIAFTFAGTVQAYAELTTLVCAVFAYAPLIILAVSVPVIVH